MGRNAGRPRNILGIVSTLGLDVLVLVIKEANGTGVHSKFGHHKGEQLR
jgi:hypothetical protein